MSSIIPVKVKLKTGVEAIIRNAKLKDAQNLLNITMSVIQERKYLVTLPDEFHVKAGDERDWIKLHLDNPNNILLIALIEDKIAGAIDFHNIPRIQMQHRGVFGMLVAKEWRGKGVGSALLAALINWGENNSVIEKISLSVMANNKEALGLYEKFGFQVEGVNIKECKLKDGSYIDVIQMYRFI